MRRIVPLAAMLLGGCYLSHEPGVAIVDASVTRPDAPALPDAGPIACAFVPRGEIQATSTPFAAHAPRIGWDGERLGLVVMESDGSIPHPVVSATRVPLDLSSTEPLRHVGEESHSWGEAAWDPATGHFGVCWSGDPGGPSRTLFRVRDRGGAEISPRIDVDPEGGPCEGLVRARDRWGLVFRHGRELVSMRAAFLDASGAIVGSVDLDDPIASPGRGAQIATDGEDFVTAQAREGEGVALTRIARGAIVATATIDAPLARYVALAVHDDGTIGLAIRDGTRETGGLRFARVSPALDPLPREALLVSPGRGARHPRIAAVPDGWAILWVEQPSDAMPSTGAILAHLDRDGVPSEPRRRVAAENSGYGAPSMLAHAGGLYLAIARPPPPVGGSEQAFVSRLDCAAPAPDRCRAHDARSSGDDCTSLDGFAWDGARCAPIVCGCLGSECDRVAATEAECLADRAGCL